MNSAEERTGQAGTELEAPYSLARRDWTAPVLKKMVAGAAELSVGQRDDGVDKS
jgi:hypothetical protein